MTDDNYVIGSGWVIEEIRENKSAYIAALFDLTIVLALVVLWGLALCGD